MLGVRRVVPRQQLGLVRHVAHCKPPPVGIGQARRQAHDQHGAEDGAAHGAQHAAPDAVDQRRVVAPHHDRGHADHKEERAQMRGYPRHALAQMQVVGARHHQKVVE